MIGQPFYPISSIFNKYKFHGTHSHGFRAKETKLYDALKSRIGKRACPHCDLHIPYLCAIIAGGASFITIFFKKIFNQTVPLSHKIPFEFKIFSSNDFRYVDCLPRFS